MSPVWRLVNGWQVVPLLRGKGHWQRLNVRDSKPMPVLIFSQVMQSCIRDFESLQHQIWRSGKSLTHHSCQWPFVLRTWCGPVTYDVPGGGKWTSRTYNDDKQMPNDSPLLPTDLRRQWLGGLRSWTSRWAFCIVALLSSLVCLDNDVILNVITRSRFRLWKTDDRITNTKYATRRKLRSVLRNILKGIKIPVCLT
jgi:hypothetical protein